METNTVKTIDEIMDAYINHEYRTKLPFVPNTAYDQVESESDLWNKQKESEHKNAIRNAKNARTKDNKRLKNQMESDIVISIMHSFDINREQSQNILDLVKNHSRTYVDVLYYLGDVGELYSLINPMHYEETKKFLDYYLHGNCHIFALALHEELGYPIQFLWDLSAEFVGPEGVKYGKALVHAYCIRPDDSLVDASGTISYEEVENDYGDVNEPEYQNIQIEEIKALMNNIILEKDKSGEIETLRNHIRTHEFFYKTNFEME